jgi:hypothetical protein
MGSNCRLSSVPGSQDQVCNIVSLSQEQDGVVTGHANDGACHKNGERPEDRGQYFVLYVLR